MIREVFSKPIVGDPEMVDADGLPRNDVLIYNDMLVCHPDLIPKMIDAAVVFLREEGIEYESCVPWRLTH